MNRQNQVYSYQYEHTVRQLVSRHSTVFDPTFTAMLFYDAFEKTGSVADAAKTVDVAVSDAQRLVPHFKRRLMG